MVAAAINFNKASSPPARLIAERSLLLNFRIKRNGDDENSDLTIVTSMHEVVEQLDGCVYFRLYI